MSSHIYPFIHICSYFSATIDSAPRKGVAHPRKGCLFREWDCWIPGVTVGVCEYPLQPINVAFNI